MASDSGNMPPVVIKKEPLSNGSSSLDSVRLSSFGVPRDLTLGGLGPLRGRGAAGKKSVVPNLNVVRNKNTNVKTSKDTSAAGRGRNRTDRGKGDRGRGRGRGGTLIQTAGVFSEGAGAINLRKSSSFRSSGPSDDSTTALRKPTLIKRETKVDIKAEALHIKELVGDSDDDDFDDFKTDLDSIPIKLNASKWNASLKLKPEKVESNNDERSSEVDDSNELTADVPTVTSSKYPSNVDEIFTRINAQLLLLQLPDSLPCVDGESDAPKSDTSKEAVVAEENTTNESSLALLEEGQIGKLVRHKSGKCKLLLGETPFNLDMGMESGFLQELMSISTNREERSGNMINLGPIQAKFTATPDWEYLFKDNS